jgi:hypothetical protein
MEVAVLQAFAQSSILFHGKGSFLFLSDPTDHEPGGWEVVKNSHSS